MSVAVSRSIATIDIEALQFIFPFGPGTRNFAGKIDRTIQIFHDACVYSVMYTKQRYGERSVPIKISSLWKVNG